jgi:hypothetical protein
MFKSCGKKERPEELSSIMGYIMPLIDLRIFMKMSLYYN